MTLDFKSNAIQKLIYNLAQILKSCYDVKNSYVYSLLNAFNFNQEKIRSYAFKIMEKYGGSITYNNIFKEWYLKELINNFNTVIKNVEEENENRKN